MFKSFTNLFICKNVECGLKDLVDGLFGWKNQLVLERRLQVSYWGPLAPARKIDNGSNACIFRQETNIRKSEFSLHENFHGV